MNKSKIMSLGVSLTMLMLVACDSQDENQRIVGQLESDRIEITAEVSEPIIERAVTEGQSVDAGHLLIRQDTARIESRIAEAKANELQARARLDELIRGPRKELIVAAQAIVRGARDELEFRETDLDRAQQVHELNLTSSELRDRAKAARDNAKANLENLKARLDELLTGTTPEELRQAEEALSQADARLASLNIDLKRHSSTAPVASVVDSLLFEVGERPAIGQARLDELIRGPRKELIVAAQAIVRGARDELEFRETDLDRAQQVHELNLTSSELRDRAKAARDNAKANLENLKARLDELLTGTTPEELRQAEEALSQADARLASLNIDLKRHSSTAPVASVVDSLLFEVGERPAIGQPMAILLSGQQPYARVFVPESMRVRVAPGTRARVFVSRNSRRAGRTRTNRSSCRPLPASAESGDGTRTWRQ